MNDIKVRLAEVSDAAGIARVQVSTWQCAYKGQMPQEFLDGMSVEKRTRRWEEILGSAKPISVTFVAESNDAIVGFCSVGACREEDMDSSTGELLAIYVDPTSHSKGAGSALHEAGFKFLRKEGYTKAILWVLTSNEKTRKWYEHKGWSAEGKTKVSQRDGFQSHETRYLITL